MLILAKIPMSQNQDIRQALNALLDKGMENKEAIYTQIVEELGVPRPTVRRVVSAFRKELEHKIQVLEKKELLLVTQ